MKNSSIKKSSLKKDRSRLLSDDAEDKVVTETTNAWSKYQSSESVLTATEAKLKAQWNTAILGASPYS